MGRPFSLTSGIAMFKSVFNEQGKATHVSYYGINGEPVVHKDGNHAWEVQLDDRGNSLVTIFWASMESPRGWPPVTRRSRPPSMRGAAKPGKLLWIRE